MTSVKNQLEKSIIGTENARTEMLNRTKQKNPLPSTHGKKEKFIYSFISKSFFINRTQQKYQ
jgi:hypothetical protein